MSEYNKEKAKKPYIKIVITLLIFLLVILALYKSGVFNLLTVENIQNLKQWIGSLGLIGPIIYIGIYIISAIFFIPATPISLLAGLAFGPVLGTFLALTGATLGATGAFLVARYLGRGMVEGWASKNEAFRKIDQGVNKEGWRMVMLTRLVPLFPYNLQNFAYGLTNIKLSTFVIVSFVCMLPGAAAFCFMSGSIVSGQSPSKVMTYLAIGAIIFVGLSLLPKVLKRKV